MHSAMSAILVVTAAAETEIMATKEKDEKGVQPRRAPKLFFVSTSSTTSTVSTTTLCFVSSNTALAACGKRRKRALIEQDKLEQNVDMDSIDPNMSR